MEKKLIIAVNNNTLVNAVAIKEQYFKSSHIDLLIIVAANNASFDNIMYDIIIHSKIFKNVYLLEMDEINRFIKFACTTKIKKLFYFNELNKYFKNKLKNIGPENYTHIICPFFVQYVPNIIEVFKKPNLIINFYEEGTSVYDCTIDELIRFNYFQIKPNNLIARIKWYTKYFFNNFILIHKLKQYVDRRMYVYWPEHLKERNVSYFKLNSLNLSIDTKLFLKVYYEHLDYIKRYIYENAKVIFLSTYIQDTVATQEKLVEDILHIIPNRKVVLKMHPSSTAVRTKFAADEEDKCYIDRDLFYFESLNINGGFSNKILISVNTSAVMNAKTMFQEEPYMIFLYKMTSYYYTSERFRTVVDKYTADLIETYNDKDKIAIPNSTLEFKYILKKFYKQVTRKDTDI